MARPLDLVSMNFVQVHYGKLTTKEMSHATGKSERTINTMITQMGLDAEVKQKREKLIQLIKDRYAEEGPNLIAAELDVTVETVTSRAKKMKVKYKYLQQARAQGRQKKHLSVKQAIRERYGLEGPTRIAMEFNRSVNAIESLAYRMRVSSDTRQERAGRTQRDNSTTCDPTPFIEMTSPEAAYYFGLWWADGSIQYKKPHYSISISLTQPEWHLLESLRDFLKCENNINGPFRMNDRVQWQSSLYITNTRLVEALMRYGMYQNKSNIDPEFPSIPEELYPSFFRGWLDGDGSISYGIKKPLKTPRVSWSGSKKAIFKLSEILISTLDLTPRIPHPSHKTATNKCWGISWAKWDDVRKILHFLHQQPGPYAHRKHAKPLAQFEEHLHLSDTGKDWGEKKPVNVSSTTLEQMFKHYRREGFPFPNPTDERKKLEWKRLQKNQGSLDLDKAEIRVGHTAKTWATSYHPHLWSTRSKGKQSPMDKFQDDTSFRAILQGRVWYGRGFSPNQIRRGLILSDPCPTKFPPSLARILIERTGIDNAKVFDPCAGWSARLIGSMAAKNTVSYFGLDPSRQTFAGLKATALDLKRLDLLGDKTVDIEATPAEYFNPPEKREFFDVVITSPPYFDREEYAAGEMTQARVTHPTEDSFINGWWKTVIDNCYQMLKPGGYMILNVGDTKALHLGWETARLLSHYEWRSSEALKWNIGSRPKRGGAQIALYEYFIIRQKN